MINTLRSYQSIRSAVFTLLTDGSSISARLIRAFITVLVLASVGLFSIEIFWSDYFHLRQRQLYLFEQVIVVVFLLEYILKVWSAPARIKFIFSFYGLIDLLAIIPFFLQIANLSFLRSVRLLRLLRITKLFRLAKLMQYVQSQLGIPAVSVTRVVQENVVKNICVIIALYFSYHYVRVFFQSVDIAVIPDILLATSVLAVAAMFGFFSLSYADLNITNTFDRFHLHLTTAVLMFPIGVMFIIVQVALAIELGTKPVFLDLTIWFVYAAIVLWDFWNVRRVSAPR